MRSTSPAPVAPVTTPDDRPDRADRVDRPDLAAVSTARREIGVFLGVVAGLTAVSTAVALGEGVDVRHIEDASALGQTVMYLSASFAAIGAVVAQLVVHRTLRRPGWGVRRAPLRAVAGAWLFTLATILTTGALLWGTGLGGLDTGAVGSSTLLGLTVLVLPYLVLALAEDIGWRGLFVTRLAQVAGPRTVVLAGGLAWSAFHWPLMFWLGGTPEGVATWFAVAMFTIGITGFGAVLASMQLRWGIWPGVVAHAVWNATLYHVVEPLTVEREHTLWFSTETGLLTAVVGVAAALLWWRFLPLVRTPEGTTAVPGRG
jgi:membrane protease YdiL (CAAX protease family)